MIAYQWNLQILVDAYTIKTLYVLRRIRAIVLVNNPTDADVRTDLEGTCHIDGSIATTTPVMVFHRPTMHLHDATARVDGHRGIDLTVIEGYEEGRHLEHRPRLATMTDGIVYHLVIFTILCTLHVHDGFHIACLHFHQDGHTHLTVYEFQLVDESALSQILHTYIDGGHDVCAINGRKHGDIEVFAKYLTTMHQTVGTSQDRVIRQFQTVFRTILGTKHITHCTLGQRAERTTTGIIFLPMETALVFRQ